MNKLRVWWVPNPPQRAFHTEVADIDEAIRVLTLLAEYDLYLGEKLVYANAGGLEVLNEDNEWEEWHNDDEEDISDVMRDRQENRR